MKKLTQTRAEALTQALTAGGHNFTLDELVEYSETLKNATTDSVLSAVSGGANGGDTSEDSITATVAAVSLAVGWFAGRNS